MSGINRSIIARANEIATASAEPIEMADALMRSVVEHVTTLDVAQAIIRDQAMSAAKKVGTLLRTIDEQPTLWDLPSHIVNRTEHGDLIIPAAQATVAQALQWATEVEEQGQAQARRGAALHRAITHVVETLDLDPDGPYREQIRAIGDQARKPIEGAE
jgi:hypothetical protein